jgi:hypothetical protein
VYTLQNAHHHEPPAKFRKQAFQVSDYSGENPYVKGTFSATWLWTLPIDKEGETIDRREFNKTINMGVFFSDE